MGLIIYMLLGYWAVGQTVYKNKILIGTGQAIFWQKAAIAFLFGWVLIPVAIVKVIIGLFSNEK